MEELNRLDWPGDIPRTPLGERENIYGNHASLSQVAREIQAELEQMGVDLDTYQLSTNLRHLDRKPHIPDRLSGDPPDAGAVARFRVGDEQQVVACDSANRVRDNLIAIRDHFRTLRRAYGEDVAPEHFRRKVSLPSRY